MSAAKIFVVKKKSLISLTIYLCAALCGASNLKKLDLSNSSLGDGGLRLCPIYKLSSLESLNISNNDIKGSSGFLTGMMKKFPFYNVRSV